MHVGEETPNLRPRGEQALAARFLRDHEDIELDADGRMNVLRPLVLETISDDALEQACADISRGDGGELREREREDGSLGPPSLHSVYSSCGAALNHFGPWRLTPRSLEVLDHSGFAELRFEEKLPIFRGGRHPNLDVLLWDGARVVAVESKLCEHLTPGKKAKFQPTYDRVGPTSHGSWAALYEALKTAPERFSYLDAGQLVRHYFGLAKQVSEGRRHAGNRPLLIYLFWEPADADDQLACRIHRQEVEEFRKLVADPDIPFVALTFRDLWSSWSAQAHQPPWLARHVQLLQERYDVAVG